MHKVIIKIYVKNSFNFWCNRARWSIFIKIPIGKGCSSWHKKKSSSLTSRLDDIYKDPISSKTNFKLHFGDMTDAQSVNNIIDKIKPDEIYNLALNHMLLYHLKFPNILLTLMLKAHCIWAIRKSKKKIKFYQAGTSDYLEKFEKYLKQKTHLI